MNVWNAGLTRAVGSRITHTFRVNGARLARNASSVAQQQLAESIGAAMQHPMGLCPNPATAWQQHNERGDGNLGAGEVNDGTNDGISEGDKLGGGGGGRGSG